MGRSCGWLTSFVCSELDEASKSLPGSDMNGLKHVQSHAGQRLCRNQGNALQLRPTQPPSAIDSQHMLLCAEVHHKSGSRGAHITGSWLSSPLCGSGLLSVLTLIVDCLTGGDCCHLVASCYGWHTEEAWQQVPGVVAGPRGAGHQPRVPQPNTC